MYKLQCCNSNSMELAMHGKTMQIETMGKPEGCKLIRLSAEIDSGIIRSLSIRGDFFASPETAFEIVEQRMKGIKLSEVCMVFNTLLKEEGVEVSGINGEGISQLLHNAYE